MLNYVYYFTLLVPIIFTCGCNCHCADAAMGASVRPPAPGRCRAVTYTLSRDFDAIFSLLNKLRRRMALVRLVKVKSHTGRLLNERADEWAERGFHTEPQEICHAPRKYGSVWLGIGPHVRASAAQLGKALPRDSAPNKPPSSTQGSSIEYLEGCWHAARSTTFVRQLLHQSEGATIACCVAWCHPAEYRVWDHCG